VMHRARCLVATLLLVAVVLVGVASGTCNKERFLEQLNITIDEVSCYGGSDAVLTIVSEDKDSGCELYLYTLKREGFQASSKGVFSKLFAGDYELVVKFVGEDEPGKMNLTVGSAAKMSFVASVEDLNNLVCDECLAEATINMSGGVGPYTFDGEVYENGTFILSWLCYGNTSFSVTDDNGCSADFILEFPPPAWCLMDNESSSSHPRDYWTLPEGMLPWLIAVCAVVLVFIVVTFAACCSWSCLSERTATEPKQKLLEQGSKPVTPRSPRSPRTPRTPRSPRSPRVDNARVHDYDASKDAGKKELHVGFKAEPEVHSDSSEPEAAPAPAPKKEVEKNSDDESNKEKKKKKKKKGEKKKKSEKKPSKSNEVELDLMQDHADVSGEEDESNTIAKRRRKKKAESEKPKADNDDSQIELETME